MILKRYSVEFETLHQDHLEMVRLWRNQDHVRMNMHYQKLLSRDDQEKWFASLDLNRNLYWIFRTNGYPIGLIHIKDIDPLRQGGEAGIFVGEPSYLEMPQPMLAILFMMELAFKALNIQQLKAKINSNNRHAISFNTQLGYEVVPDQPEGFQYYQVSEERFDGFTERLRAQTAHMYGGHTIVSRVNSLNALGSDIVKGITREDDYFQPQFI